jgi:hypothetical protein
MLGEVHELLQASTRTLRSRDKAPTRGGVGVGKA